MTVLLNSLVMCYLYKHVFGRFGVSCSFLSLSTVSSVGKRKKKLDEEKGGRSKQVGRDPFKLVFITLKNKACM